MKKYNSIFIAAILLFLNACSDTTNTSSEENKNYNAADSAVGNSEAANQIYRDSTDLKHATESGGGTGNPAARYDSSTNSKNR